MKKLSEINNTFPIIELKDSKIENISYYTDSEPSLCSTCDYNQSFIVELNIYFENDEFERIKYYDSQNYLFSESDLIIFFTTNLNDFIRMTKDEFIEFIRNEHNIL